MKISKGLFIVAFVFLCISWALDLTDVGSAQGFTNLGLMWMVMGFIMKETDE